MRPLPASQRFALRRQVSVLAPDSESALANPAALDACCWVKVANKGAGQKLKTVAPSPIHFHSGVAPPISALPTSGDS